jgi:hypothetical protein
MHACNALDGPLWRLPKYEPAAPPVRLDGWDKDFLQFFRWLGQRRAIEAATLPAAGTTTRHRA